MRLLRAVSSLCCFAALSLVASGCGITILGKGTDRDEQSGGGSGTAAGVGGGSGVGGGDSCLPSIPVTSQIPRLLNRQYDAVVRDLLGVATLESAGNLPPSALLVADFDGDMTDSAWSGYLAAAEHLAAEVMGGPNKPRFLACDPAASRCLEETIIAFGRRAFRRPLLEEEVQSLLRLTAVEPQGTPEEIAEAILFAFLASPSFIMRPELAQEPEGAAIKLSSYEVAARLSFLLWDSVPDEALDAAADAGQLATKEQILAQAQRMIQDREKTAPVVAQFHRVYADIRPGSRWGAVEHDTTRFPDYSPDMVAPMMAEMDALFEEVAFEGGSFEDLFLSNVGYVNQDTAPLYGLNAADYGADLTRVELDPNERPGFLTRVGFLSSYSRYDATNPILRGAFVATRLLGLSLAPVPGASETPRPAGPFSTEREAVEALTSTAECAGCHSTYINPPGFVLERYDAVGKVQTIDPLGGPIDGTADVTFGADDVKKITSPIDLMNELAVDPGARRHYAERWVAFATGRAPNESDACDVDGLSANLSADGYTILDLLADLTQTDSFRLRITGN
ncbi:DUF1592 domain-containing protein [Sorangium sp. So ce726]|uniref:DUF1592 domain-containing protein n=1 Tax=Sorangium sp. So ce726 TaxID=3133319 RepID=UPI003F5F9DE9